MKRTIFTTCMFRVAMTLLVVLLCSTQVVRATDFITDVMVIGNNDKTAFDKLQSDYEAQGWIAVNKDLNAGCGSGSDYIHLLYKKQSSPGSSGIPITDFYIKTGKNPPASLTHERRTYNLLPCDGSDNFINSQGDLNRGAGGDYIHLYYTNAPVPNYNAVTGITFNDTKSGAVGSDGGTTGYDLNSDCGSGSAYIYMHVTVTRGPVELTSSTAEVTLQDGDVVFGTGGKDTKITIADGATVTLNGVDITAIPDNESYLWAGITCLGDAVIILANGTTNKVSGGMWNSGIFVPEGHTLTIHGNGSLDATGGINSAGIGSGREGSCGDITISGGNITATSGDIGAGIGSGFSGSCGDISISSGNITATGGSNSAGIGSGYNYSSCGNITISGGTINATGDSHSAGIGSGYSSSCGNISISGGNITATSRDYSAGIGSGYYGSCGDITIGDDINRVSATFGENAWTAIGQGVYGSCGTVTIAQSLIDMSAGKTRTLWPGHADLGFYDNADNTASINGHAGSKKYDIQLRGRTIYRDGTWNTLCLPFDLDDLTGTLLEGFTVMELDTKSTQEGHTTGFDPTDLAYHINFKPATDIKAGVPYIVRCTSDKGSVANPVFYGVTVKNVTPATVASADGTVSFTGSYSPVALGSYEYTKLFLGESNKLHYPSAKMDIGSFRASFQLAISKMGDVDNDGGVSLNDILAIVNHILGTHNDTFIFERADLDKDKGVSLADILLVVDIILNQDQDIKVDVYTGSTPITYDGKGNGEGR